MNWIKCSDKMPKDENYMYEHDYVYICAQSPKDGPGPLFGIGKYYEDDGWEIMGNEGAHSDTGTYYMNKEYVTHWCFIESPE